MKYLIVGAGAIGAYVGARMHNAGIDVTLLARGAHLAAMRRNGVRVTSSRGDFEARPRVAGSLQEAGPVDVVILAVKAHSLPQIAPQLGAVLGPETTVVSTQNGVPWWFFQQFPGPLQGIVLERIDPGGAISKAIDVRRVIGGIVYISTEIVQPGVIHHHEGDRISLGEPDGTRSERIREISGALIASGLRAPVTAHIRQEIWVKLLGNTAFNPVSALTGATLGELTSDPEVSTLIRNIMQEAEGVALKLGMELPISIEKRMAGAAKVGGHKTSMLQDLEAGRPPELEAVVGAVLELGDRLDLPMTHTRAIYACTRLLWQCRAGRTN